MKLALDNIVLDALRELAEARRASSDWYRNNRETADDDKRLTDRDAIHERLHNAEERIEAIAMALFPAKKKAPRARKSRVA